MFNRALQRFCHSEHLSGGGAFSACPIVLALVVNVDGLASDCMELKLTIEPHVAQRFGVKLFCSPDLEEETVIRYDTEQQAFVVDFENASNDRTLSYRCGREVLKSGGLKQTVPFALGDDQVLELDIFVDRSVIEIFVNSEVCIVQRVYPMRPDSKEVRLFCEDGRIASIPTALCQPCGSHNLYGR
ncbi:MAG: GH32 C-terminal domain-containing protein [Candidatus Poribacteria bacterium]|nr:GH32 C-terminal domain-containing protein [Candidatus Poribacteria bacterium]